MPGEGHLKVTIFHAFSVVAIRHMVQTGSQKYGCKKMPRGLSIPSSVGQIDGSLGGGHWLKPVAAAHPPRDMEWLKCSGLFIGHGLTNTSSFSDVSAHPAPKDHFSSPTSKCADDGRQGQMS